MKAFLLSVIVAVGLAVGAAMVLDRNFQVDSPTAFTTEGARITSPGDNLVEF